MAAVKVELAQVHEWAEHAAQRLKAALRLQVGNMDVGDDAGVADSASADLVGREVVGAASDMLLHNNYVELETAHNSQNGTHPSASVMTPRGVAAIAAAAGVAGFPSWASPGR